MVRDTSPNIDLLRPQQLANLSPVFQPSGLVLHSFLLLVQKCTKLIELVLMLKLCQAGS
jgi:hypothetical protein